MMAEDGYRTLSPEAWTAKYKPAVDHPLEVSLANATNSLERQLTFVGDLKYIEFQALGVRRTLQDSYERARAIHVTVDSLRPVLESDNWIAHGVTFCRRFFARASRPSMRSLVLGSISPKAAVQPIATSSRGAS